MKRNNRDCKIVRDLLPNYIENLTDEVTNEYINEHITKCPECEQVLKDMSGEINLEVINQDKEIKYLKKIKKRVRNTILIVSSIVIIAASSIVCYVYNKSKIEVNNYTFLKGSYLTYNNEESENGEINSLMIAVFNEKDICISVRVIEKGYKDNILQSKIDLENENLKSIPMNIKVIDKEIHYNVNVWNGLEKENVKNIWKKFYTGIQIEEI